MGGTIGPEPEYYVKKFLKCSRCELFNGTRECPVCYGKGYKEVMVPERREAKKNTP